MGKWRQNLNRKAQTGDDLHSARHGGRSLSHAEAGAAGDVTRPGCAAFTLAGEFLEY